MSKAYYLFGAHQKCVSHDMGVFLRLALHEGNRTRAQLLRARGVAPETVQELCAFRGVCGEPDVEQYDEDIATLGSANSSASDVRCTLRDSGFEDDAINAWFERASELDFVCTEDDYFGAEDETWTSDLSGDRYYGTSDQLKIYTASHDWEYRHESDGQYFWCHGSDRYYDSEIYTESSMPVGTTTVCTGCRKDPKAKTKKTKTKSYRGTVYATGQP
jgi:hypothetical protein